MLSFLLSVGLLLLLVLVVILQIIGTVIIGPAASISHPRDLTLFLLLLVWRSLLLLLWLFLAGIFYFHFAVSLLLLLLHGSRKSTHVGLNAVENHFIDIFREKDFNNSL